MEKSIRNEWKIAILGALSINFSGKALKKGDCLDIIRGHVGALVVWVNSGFKQGRCEI